MARIQTNYYGADTTTQFQWATDDGDRFDREFDLYRLSQALENHDHSNTRGLPVARVADGTLLTASYGPLSIDSAALANLSVTTAKIGAGAVTRDRLATPLLQPTNNAAGGLNLGSAAGPGTYVGWWYVSDTGQVVYGTGADTAFFFDQNRRIAFGPSASTVAAQYSFMQMGSTINDGIRIEQNGFPGRWAAFYVDGSGNVQLQAANSQILIGGAGASYMIPASDNSHTCGGPGNRWSVVYSGVCNTTTVSAANISVSGTIGTQNLQATGDITGSNQVFGANVLRTNGTVFSNVCQSNQVTTGTVSATTVGISGTFSGNFINTSSAAFNGAMSSGSVACSGALSANTANIASALGIAGASLTHNLAVAVDSCAKPGGGTWATYSDSRAKYKSKFRPFRQGLDILTQLEPEYYTYSGDYGLPKGEEFVGIRSEHLQEVAPDMVKTVKMARKKGATEDDFLTVNYHNLTFMLLNAVKELASRVEAMESRKN